MLMFYCNMLSIQVHQRSHTMLDCVRSATCLSVVDCCLGVKYGVLPCRSHAMDSRHSAPVVHYLLEVLPELHDDSSTSAASLLLHILTSSAAPAQLLHSAMALLNKLPLDDESSSAPSDTQLQLACELLQPFTAEAFQGLPKGKGKAAKAAAAPTVAGLEVLLRLVRYRPRQGDGQPAEKLRLAAFQRLGAELYAVMPVQQQMEAFLVSSCFTASCIVGWQLAVPNCFHPFSFLLLVFSFSWSSRFWLSTVVV